MSLSKAEVWGRYSIWLLDWVPSLSCGTLFVLDAWNLCVVLVYGPSAEKRSQTQTRAVRNLRIVHAESSGRG